MRQRSIARVLLLTLAAVAFSCAKEQHKNETAKTLDTVAFNLNPSVSYGPLAIAIEEGFFTQEGIDPKPVPLDSNAAVAAATAGKIDVLSAGVRSSVFNTILRGAPLRVVADKGHPRPDCTEMAFVAPIATAQRIARNKGSLRGERVAMIRGGIAEHVTMQFIQQSGTPVREVTLVQLQQGAHAWGRDRVDAIRLLFEPSLTASLDEGWAAIVATGHQVAPDRQSSILVFGKRLLQDDPQLGRRFLRAYLRGVRQFNQGKTPRNVAIMARLTKLPEPLIRKSCWEAFADDGLLEPRKVQPFLDWAVAQNYLDAPIATGLWWNPAPVTAAARDLDAKGR